MRILHIAYYTFKRKFLGSIPTMIILPLILIFILGNSLKLLYGSIKDAGSDTLAVYGANADEFKSIENFLKGNKSFKNYIKIVKVNQKEKAINELKEGRYSAFIDVKSRKVYSNAINTVDASLIQSFIKTYNFSGNKNIQFGNIKNMYNSEKRRMNAISYYSVTMLVMIILYGAEYGVGNIDDDEEMINKTISLPMSREKIIIGRNLGAILVMFASSIVIIVFSKFVYGTYVGSNYFLLIFDVILFSFFSVNLGSAICLIAKNGETASYIIETLAIIFTLLGGGYFTTEFFSANLKKISFLSPNYAEQNILFEMIYGYGKNVTEYYLQIIALSLIAFGITVFYGRKHVK